MTDRSCDTCKHAFWDDVCARMRCRLAAEMRAYNDLRVQEFSA